jgi:hypothetical protein
VDRPCSRRLKPQEWHDAVRSRGDDRALPDCNDGTAARAVYGL